MKKTYLFKQSREPRVVLWNYLILLLLFGCGSVFGQTPTPSPWEDSPRSAMQMLIHYTQVPITQIPPLFESRSLPRSELKSELKSELLQVKRFLEILDLYGQVDLNRVSKDPKGKLEDGLEPSREKVAKIQVGGRTVDIYLTLKEAGGSRQWVVEKETFKNVVSLDLPQPRMVFAQWFPEKWALTEWGGLAVWQWIGVGIFITLGLGLASLLHVLLRKKILSWLLPNQFKEAQVFFSKIKSPLIWCLTLIVFQTLLPLLEFPLLLRQGVHFLGRFCYLGLGLLVTIRFIQFALEHYGQYLKKNEKWGGVAMLPSAQKILNTLVFAVFLLLFLRAAGFDVSGLIAGLGVGGLAVAFGGQKTLENLFAGVRVLLDQPIRVGDLGKFGATQGTVEEIGLNSVRVRTPERSLVTISNTEFAQMKIENLQKRDKTYFKSTLLMAHPVSTSVLESVLLGMRHTLCQKEWVEPDSSWVHFTQFLSQGIQVESNAYFLTTDHTQFLKFREILLLEFMKILESHSVSLLASPLPMESMVQSPKSSP